MYESPIELTTNKIMSNISKQLDNDILQAVMETSIKVDKDELIRALQYDRNQYEKGYEDGYKEGMNAMKSQIIKLIRRLEESELGKKDD